MRLTITMLVFLMGAVATAAPRVELIALGWQQALQESDFFAPEAALVESPVESAAVESLIADALATTSPKLQSVWLDGSATAVSFVIPAREDSAAMGLLPKDYAARAARRGTVVAVGGLLGYRVGDGPWATVKNNARNVALVALAALGAGL